MAAPDESPGIPAKKARPDRLPIGTLVAYAVPVAGVSFLSMLLTILYMKFATDVLLLAPAVVGLIFFLSRIWDAISDPLVGYLSDKTRGPLGRRRSWMLASSVPLVLFSAMLWGPPASLQGAALFVWVTIGIFGFYTVYTVFGVPHMALGAEFTTDVQERNRVFGARQISWGVGIVAAAGLGVSLMENPADARRMGFLVGLGGGLAAGVTILLAVAFLPRERADYMGRGGKSPLRSVRDVWQNPHARLLLFVFLIQQFGAGGVSVLFPYVTQYILKRPEFLSEVMLIFVGLAMLSIPVWVWLGNFYERRNLWIFAMCMSCVGYVAVLFVREGAYLPMVILAVCSGLSNGCGSTLGQAIKADVIDFDEYQTGERKEGSYFAAWAFTEKLAQGSMIGIVGIALGWSGFVPNVEQTVFVKGVMLFLMGGLPCLVFAIGIIAFSRFKLNRAENARIRREIDARTAAARAE